MTSLLKSIFIFLLSTLILMNQETKKKKITIFLKEKLLINKLYPSVDQFLNHSFPKEKAILLNWASPMRKGNNYIIAGDIQDFLNQQFPEKNYIIYGEGIHVYYQQKKTIKPYSVMMEKNFLQQQQTILKQFIKKKPTKKNKQIRYFFEKKYEDEPYLKKGTSLQIQYQYGNILIKGKGILKNTIKNERGVKKEIKVAYNNRKITYQATIGKDINFK